MDHFTVRCFKLSKAFEPKEVTCEISGNKLTVTFKKDQESLFLLDGGKVNSIDNKLIDNEKLVVVTLSLLHLGDNSARKKIKEKEKKKKDKKQKKDKKKQKEEEEENFEKKISVEKDLILAFSQAAVEPFFKNLNQHGVKVCLLQYS
eukprot:TRINITY_DN1201_c2_g1_i2.p1 TRINITY_DN1201_c2_g1~~TRINITY_DN1201_c2_g1_i2.p1  ORF type:complete len:147 (-),score=57.74 TRINITY_DN1201_c2_g1_i2:136-576(-)